jgi:hypothetical protein
MFRVSRPIEFVMLNSVIRPQSLAGDGELRAAGLTRPIIALHSDFRMRVVSTPGLPGHIFSMITVEESI